MQVQELIVEDAKTHLPQCRATGASLRTAARYTLTCSAERDATLPRYRRHRASGILQRPHSSRPPCMGRPVFATSGAQPLRGRRALDHASLLRPRHRRRRDDDVRTCGSAAAGRRRSVNCGVRGRRESLRWCARGVRRRRRRRAPDGWCVSESQGHFASTVTPSPPRHRRHAIAATASPKLRAQEVSRSHSSGTKFVWACGR